MSFTSSTLAGGARRLAGSLGALVKRRHPARTAVPGPHKSRASLCAEARAGLQGAMGTLETLFAGIGDELGTLDNHCQDMLRKCDELQQLSSGNHKGDTLIKEIRELLSPPLEYIDFCIERQTQLLVLLRQCEDRTREMIAVRAQMDDALSPLSFMTVLFKIESAYLPEDLRDTFITVTLEVEKLRALVSETFTKNTEQLLLTHKTLSSVRAHLEEVYARQAADVSHKRKNIESAFESLDTQLDKNVARDNRMQSVSNELAIEVSKVVLGLQFQDIIKQKSDLIVQAIDEVDRTGATTSPAKLDLDAVVSSMAQGSDSIHEGVNRIQSQMEVLEHSSLMQVSDDDSEITTDQLVQILLDTIQDVWDIIEAVFRQTEQAHTAVQPAGDIALNLSSALTELAINMKLIALNAQVRSVQIGTGTGLETLAARTAEISQEISLISEHTTTDLQKLQSAISEMLGTFGEFKTKGREQLDRLSELRTPTELRLHSLRDHSIAAVHTIGTGVDAIRGSVEHLNAQLVRLDEVRGNLTDSAQALGNLRTHLGLPAIVAVVSGAALPTAQATAVAAAAAPESLEMFGAEDSGTDTQAAPAGLPGSAVAELPPPPAEILFDTAPAVSGESTEQTPEQAPEQEKKPSPPAKPPVDNSNVEFF